MFPPQGIESEFAIILLKYDTKILSESDIECYNVSSHELILTEECSDRLKKMKEPLTGDFVIIIYGEEVLMGYMYPHMFHGLIHLLKL